MEWHLRMRMGYNVGHGGGVVSVVVVAKEREFVISTGRSNSGQAKCQATASFPTRASGLAVARPALNCCT